MTKQEVENEVMELIDNNCTDMSMDDYKELLGDIIDNLQSRLDAAENDD